MGRIIRGLGALVAYVAIATLLAELIGVGFLLSRGQLTEEKVSQLVAVVQGIELPKPDTPQPKSTAKSTTRQISPDDVARARALKTRDLELREQSLENSLATLKFEQAKLLDEKDRYEVIKTAFEAQLKDLREGAIASNQENARLILENITPKQAKEQILKMIEKQELDQVVTLLSLMPINKRAAIFKTFKSEEESQQLATILKTIREGVPEVPLIDQTKKELERPESTSP